LLTDADLFLGAAIGHMPMVRVEVPVEVEYGTSARLSRCGALFWVSHRHLLRIRGCFVVRGGGTANAEQVPPPCSNTDAGLIFDSGLF
jgi:hypothetical protein